MAHAQAADFSAIGPLVAVLLRFVAIYSLFDTMNIIFASAIKGAGDTRYVMYVITGVSVFVLALPSYIAIDVLGLGIYAGWTIVSVYVIVMGVLFLNRFRKGAWKAMRVIEPRICSASITSHCEAPVPE